MIWVDSVSAGKLGSFTPVTTCCLTGLKKKYVKKRVCGVENADITSGVHEDDWPNGLDTGQRSDLFAILKELSITRGGRASGDTHARIL